MAQQSKKYTGWWGLCLVSLAGFFVLSIGVATNAAWLHMLDQPLQQLAENVRTVNRTTWFSHLAFWGTPMINLLICVVIGVGLWFIGHRSEVGQLIWLELGINLLTYLGKHFFQRSRPLGKLVAQGGFSFPSGHTTSTLMMVLIVLFYVVPLLKNQEWQLVVGLVSLIWFGMIGFDRIYLFVHYPTDVLGGSCLALFWLACVKLGTYYFTSSKVQRSTV